ncbi:helix-turn-helix domain-containing protein [Streptomyces alkaliphilus]|uniref:helix-turn-helix domain-containing protein n=1 Tax=Streptomyces alkaliphilus TaxID=1472722 RepID=UPI00117EB578|nr:helix-turn-helix transcriptional regulator [Streptomyces alkaliphilus]MQS05801.1 helix-turn-helix domain-containing protein [Streptomyces alkaliphilus]
MTVVANTGPLAARRKLGTELRVLRDRHGWTAEEVGAHLGCHISKVSRLELGKRACTKRDFESLMNLYDVDSDRRAELRELMLRSIQRTPPWWHAYNDVISANYAEFLTYEAEASHCREHQPLLIPGLVQTEAYARAVTTYGIDAVGPQQVDTLVEVRMRRQERLRESPPLQMDLVITEASLRVKVGGPATMKGQLCHLLSLQGVENVSLRVIPFEAGEKGTSTGAFTLFATGVGTSVDAAFIESAETRTTFRDDPIAVRRLDRLFDHLASAALSREASATLIEHIAKEMEHSA